MEDHTCLDFQLPSIFILSEKMVSATIIAIKISVAFALNVYCFFQWSLDFEVYNIGNCYLEIKLNHFSQNGNKDERDYALYNKQYVHLVWEQESNSYEPFLFVSVHTDLCRRRLVRYRKYMKRLTYSSAGQLE